MDDAQLTNHDLDTTTGGVDVTAPFSQPLVNQALRDQLLPEAGVDSISLLQRQPLQHRTGGYL